MRDNLDVSLLDDLQWRGLLQDSTDLDELRKHLDAGTVTFYVGFDPTAASLHLGHLMQVITARRLQRAGHRPLLLVGGATGQIGDPKETGERTLNPPEVIAGWVERIRSQLAPFVTYQGRNAATLVNNLDWTGEMSAIEFLRDVGKHFPINRMLAREVVKARLESGMSFTEFSYQLLQSHDFYELHRRHDCTLQFGGSDQWGNITAGVDYVRRRGAGPVHAFTTPLVTKSDGTKFGKTEGGAVWLDPEMTSPYAFYQFWVNTEDAGRRKVLEVLQLRRSRRPRRTGEGHRGATRRPGGAAGTGPGAHHAGTRRGGMRSGDRGLAGALRPRIPVRPGAGDPGRRARGGRAHAHLRWSCVRWAGRRRRGWGCSGG